MPPSRAGLARPRNYASRAQASRPSTSSSNASSSRRDQRASQAEAREQLQSQRHGRSRAADEVEPEEEVEEEDDAEEEEDAGGAVDDQDEGADDEDEDEELRLPKRQKLPVSDSVKGVLQALGKAEVERKINELVRFALFSEYRRQPIRRDDISKKVLGKNASRAFPYIFNRAQAMLRNTFNYELVEVRSKGADREALLSQAAAEAKGSATQRNGDGEGAKKDKSAANTSSKVYMLRNICGAKVVEAASLPRLRVTYPHHYPDNGSHHRPMVDWDKGDSQLGSMGLTFLILSLILLNGRTLPDDQFRALLHRLGLEKAAQLPASLCPDSLAVGAPQTQDARSQRGDTIPSDSTSHPTTLSSFLAQLLKQGYLETFKSPTAGGGGGTSGRGRGRGGADDEGRGDPNEGLEWRWGPRADAEIGETAVAEFVRTVYVDCEDLASGGAGGGGAAEREQDEEEPPEEEEEDSAPNTSTWRAARSSYAGRSAGRRSDALRRTQQTQQTQQTQAQSRQQREKRQKESQALLREIERAAGSQLLG